MRGARGPHPDIDGLQVSGNRPLACRVVDHLLNLGRGAQPLQAVVLARSLRKRRRRPQHALAPTRCLVRESTDQCAEDDLVDLTRHLMSDESLGPVAGREEASLQGRLRKDRERRRYAPAEKEVRQNLCDELRRAHAALKNLLDGRVVRLALKRKKRIGQREQLGEGATRARLTFLIGLVTNESQSSLLPISPGRAQSRMHQNSSNRFWIAVPVRPKRMGCSARPKVKGKG